MLQYSGGGYLVKNSKCDDDIGYFMFMRLFHFYYIFVNIFTFFKSSKTI